MTHSNLWDDLYKQLKEELGRDPTTTEVQQALIYYDFEDIWEEENGITSSATT